MIIAFYNIGDYLSFGRETINVMGPSGPIMVKISGEKAKVALTKCK